MKYTPEPWTVAEDCGDFDTNAIYAAGGKKIVFWGGHYNVPKEEGDANAVRIAACVNGCQGINPAAVPDLLGALKEIAGKLLGPGAFPLIARARAAIARAERN